MAGRPSRRLIFLTMRKTASGPRISMLKSSLEVLNHGIVHCLSMGWWNSASGRRTTWPNTKPSPCRKTPSLSQRKEARRGCSDQSTWLAQRRPAHP
jgi:hypothetical protein